MERAPAEHPISRKMKSLVTCVIVLAAFAHVDSDRGGINQQNPTREFGPRKCGPADPTYIRIANETGGQPFFLNPSELGASTHIMSEQSLSDRELIVWANAASENAPREYVVPIDSSVKRFTISASFDREGGTLNVISPDGTVNARPTGSEETILNCAHVLTIDRPATGEWRARVVATGRFWLVAHARTELSLVTAQFVRPGGRPGHEGLFPIQGQPLANKPATLRTRMFDSVSSPRFALVSLEGTVLREVDLEKVDDEEFVGPIELPSQGFRVAAMGTDPAGLSYQRLYAPVFRAASVELSVAGNEELRAGSTTPIPIVVRNHGPAARFRLVVVYGQGVVGVVDPAVVDLAQGAEATATASVKVPPNTSPGSPFDLTVTAESEGTSGTTNSAVRQFTIVAPPQ
jgi:hypothetical protein